MENERALRDVLERTQADLKAAQALVEDLERRQRLTLAREAALATEAAASRARIAELQAQLTLSSSGEAELARLRGELSTVQQRLAALDQQSPRVNGHACLRCGSLALAPARLRVNNWPLNAQLDRDPSAMLLRETVNAALYALVCGDCGGAELVADGPQQLYQAYLAAKDAGG